MSRQLASVVTTTVIDHHLFGLVDREYPGEEIPAPHKSGAWVQAGRASILVESPYDNIDAILRLEEWDGEPGPPPDDGAPWDDTVVVTVECPTGAIGLNQITAGYADTGFSVTEPGMFHVDLSCRNGAAAMRALDIKEEYLVRYWAAR